MFVDETHRGGLIVVATWVRSQQVNEIRKALLALRSKGEARIHFRKLDNARRTDVLRTIAGFDVVATTYRVELKQKRLARATAMRLLFGDVSAREARRVAIERDDTLVASDQAVAAEALGRRREIEVVHLRAVEDPLLWMSDSLGWCLQRGGDWAAAVTHLIRETPE